MNKNLLITLCTLLLPALAVRGQARVDSLRWEASLSAEVGSGQFAPFWFSTNTYGMGSVKPNNLRLEAGIYKDMCRDNRWSWGAGLELAGGIAQQQPFHIQQAYGEIRYRCLDLMVGQKEIPGYGVDPEALYGQSPFLQ